MTDTHDDLIRKRAYEIWEAEGFPAGREFAHWEQAVRELSEEKTEVETIEGSTPQPLSIVNDEDAADITPDVIARKRGKTAS